MESKQEVKEKKSRAPRVKKVSVPLKEEAQ
jgi:hypothetical protein